MIDAQNKLWHHAVIAIFSLLLVYLMYLSGIKIGRGVGAVPFIILFLVMVIGPLMEIFPSIYKNSPGEFPYSWRAELGIWFAVWAVIHVLFVFHARDWNVLEYLLGISPWALGALIATFMAVILALISFRGAIRYIGKNSWKWLQNYFTYVIFWLTGIHVLDRALLRPGFPSGDSLHWMYLIMFFTVIVLQFIGFVIVVKKHRNSLNNIEKDKETPEKNPKENFS